MTKYFINQFAEDGDFSEVPNDIQTSGAVSYRIGFGVDYQRKLGTDPLAKPFGRQPFNGLLYDITGAVQQYQQQGNFGFITPEMNGGNPFPYVMGAMVRYDVSSAQDGSEAGVFISQKSSNTGNPKDNPTDWIKIGESNGGGYGFAFTRINANTVLTAAEAGVVLIDASASDLVVTLPPANLGMGFILRRVDSTANMVMVVCNSADKIYYNSALNLNGYNFFSLYGSGDFWRVASDGVNGWYDIDRRSTEQVGSIITSASVIAPVGGFIPLDGNQLSRAMYPSLWDYAQKSGNIVSETDWNSFTGSFSTGDGASSFRVPNTLGYFIRNLNSSSSGIDSGRTIGTSQKNAIQNIVGTISNGASVDQTTGVFSNSGTGRAGTTSSAGGGRDIKFDASTVVDTADEVRPYNIAYPYYMKVI